MSGLAPLSRRTRFRTGVRALVPQLPLVLTSLVSLGGGLLLRASASGDRAIVAVPATLFLLLVGLCLIHVASNFFENQRVLGRGSFVRILAEVESACASNESEFKLVPLRDFISDIERPVPAGTTIDVLTHDIGAYDAIDIVRGQLVTNMLKGIRFRYYIPARPAVEEALMSLLSAAIDDATRTRDLSHEDASRAIHSAVEIYTVPAIALYYFALQTPPGGARPIGLWYLTARDKDCEPDDGTQIVYMTLSDDNLNKLVDLFWQMRVHGFKRELE